jgi:hypothetical protein
MGIPGSGSRRVRRGGRAVSSLRSWGRNGGGLWPRLVRREPIITEICKVARG